MESDWSFPHASKIKLASHLSYTSHCGMASVDLENRVSSRLRGAHASHLFGCIMIAAVRGGSAWWTKVLNPWAHSDLRESCALAILELTDRVDLDSVLLP